MCSHIPWLRSLSKPEMQCATTPPQAWHLLTALIVSCMFMLSIHLVTVEACEQPCVCDALHACIQAPPVTLLRHALTDCKACRVPEGTVDTVLTYCHYCLNNTSALSILPYLKSKGVGIINASPLSLGMLSPHVGPPHPPPPSPALWVFCV